MSRTKGCRVQPFDRFPVEVIRLCSSLFDKKSTEIQVALFVGQTIKADQSQFNFRVSAISRQLMGSAAKYRCQIIGQPKWLY